MIRIIKNTIIAILIAAGLIAAGMIYSYVDWHDTNPGRVDRVQAESQPKPCPDGSYNIGTKDGINPICKLEPTGCPYGDSIPMEHCDKFAPEQNVSKEIMPTLEDSNYGGGK